MATPCQIKKLINKGDLDAKIASVYGCKQEDAQPYAQRFAGAKFMEFGYPVGGTCLFQ